MSRKKTYEVTVYRTLVYTDEVLATSEEEAQDILLKEIINNEITLADFEEYELVPEVYEV